MRVVGTRCGHGVSRQLTFVVMGPGSRSLVARLSGTTESNLHHLPRLQRSEFFARQFCLVERLAERNHGRVDRLISELEGAVMMRKRLRCAAIGQCFHGV